jgi:hypothetical protein
MTYALRDRFLHVMTGREAADWFAANFCRPAPRPIAGVPVDPDGIGVDSFNRMEAVLGNFDLMDRLAWFAQLGEYWTICDRIAPHRARLREILRGATRAELDAMMTHEERQALDALPEHITVYRGCYAFNRAGLSWSTDRATAVRFVSLNRFHHPDHAPILRIGLARRSRLALKLDRTEAEVIAHSVQKIVEQRIEPAR